MKIIISERKIQKPLDKPVMTSITSNNQLTTVIKQSKNKETIPVIVEEIKSEQKESPSPIQKTILKLAPTTHKHIHITPHTSVKNDKVDLFINSYSENHRELYANLFKIKMSEKGLHIPSQDKIFFETVITRETFNNYITSNEEVYDYTHQQLHYTWNAVIKEEPKDHLIDTLSLHSIGYDFKLKHTPALAIETGGQNYHEKPLREFLELARTLMKDEKVIMQFGFQPSEKEWYKEGVKTTKELPKRKIISESSKMKLGYNGFDCVIRLIVTGSVSNRIEQIATGYIFALKQLNGDNELIEKKVKHKKFNSWYEKYVLQRKIPIPFSFNKRIILTEKEMKHFIKMPQSSLQKEFNLQSVERVESDVPKCLQTKTGIPIGDADYKGIIYPIRLPFGIDKNILDDFMKSYVFTGSPRMGKDTSIVNLIVESAKKGCGAFVPDVINEKGNDRGMADSIRDSLPSDKIIDLDLVDHLNPIYFGLEDVAAMIGENGMNVIADNFVKVLGLETTTNAQELCYVISRACKCNIYKMYCFLKSKKYAYQIYEQLLKEDELLAMEIKYEYLESNRTESDIGVKTLKTRLRVILGNPHFKNMIAQEPNPKINFEQWIRERKVVILRMKKMAIGDVGVKILMYLITMKIFWLKKIMETDDCTFLVYNEPHQFMSEGLQELMESMLVECPKYRLSLLFAFHNYKHLPDRLWEIMKSSSINWFLFKNTNHKFYKSIEEQLNPITVESAMKTKQYESIFLPFIGGEQLTPFFMKMMPPPIQRQDMFDNENLTTRHSQEYGRPVQVVRELIKSIEMSMYEEAEEEKEAKSKKSKKKDS